MARQGACLLAVVFVLSSIGCSSGAGQDATRADSDHPEANELYLQARALERGYVSADDWRSAETLYQRALELDPDFAPVHAGLARVHATMVHFKYEPTAERRKRSQEAATTALRLQPGLGDVHYALAGTFEALGRDDEAIEALRRAEALNPDAHQVARAWVTFHQGGGLDALENALRLLPEGFDPDGRITLDRYSLAWLQRRGDEALRVLATSAHSLIQDQRHYLPVPLLSARAHRLRRDQGAATKAYDSARVVLESAAREQPVDSRVRVSLASALAGLGRSAKARAEVNRALEVLPVDALMAPQISYQAARVLAEIGERDAALDILAGVYARPIAWYSRRYLERDPVWEPMRGHPKYQEIVAAGAN